MLACGGMWETADEILALQALMDASHARSTTHLHDVVSAERRLSAEQVVQALEHEGAEPCDRDREGRAACERGGRALPARQVDVRDG